MAVVLASDAAGEDQGTLLDVALQAQQRVLRRVSLTGGFGVRWADSEFTETFLGVDARQSERSMSPIYSADGGVNEVRAFLRATY